MNQKTDILSLPVRPYILDEGETVNTVADKFNINAEQLRRLNQFRTFRNGIEHLQRGDELDVPLAPLPSVKWEGNNSDAASDDQTQKVASFMSGAGNFLTSNPNVDAVTSMARGMVASESSSQIQQWLSQFGTARVQLDTDKNFSLKGSQFDLLVPLYEKKNWLAFTQESLHRTDDRTQSSLGFGLRWLNDGWLLGGNTFLDYDLSREHARAGLGLEYWRDFLKLGANSYLRLTRWKNSPDVEDYEERPANGWDIRAQAWLPALPQLGGKVTYEQYYGKEVALFGKDNRQRDPHAITAGISYTPIPLLTLSAEQRQGEAGKNASLLGVEMNYQLGVPWRRQVDPNAVASMRSLAGSRYDLVERNNNIVLEYRKKEVIHLHTADLVTGQPGEQKSLNVSVTSKYGLARIDWSAAPLLAMGGKIVQDKNGYSVLLPPYQFAAQGVNTYTISGVAVDSKGNQSDRSETQVTVLAPTINQQNTTFTPADSTLPADGKSSQVLTLTLKDENNHPVDMNASDITLDTGKLKSTTVSSLLRKAAGVYSTTVTAGTDKEMVMLTPQVSGITLSSAKVAMMPSIPAQATSLVTTDSTAYHSGGTMQVTVMLKDAAGNAVSGAASALTAETVTVANAEQKDGSWKDNGDGTYNAAYTATVAGTGLKAALKLNGWKGQSESAAYAITSSQPAQETSLITTDNAAYISGGTMQITVMLKDAAGNAVSGAASALTAETVTVANAEQKDGSWKDNGDG
ncbi:inverse autotransporter beta domain-containing protein, partial [Dryocola boscaweniae]|uniref:inverse autotransporter beta domain-containing protein n=1 Tax=Dryocola boscaweniae TaxID=2925397 RepID=UPI0022F0762F